MIDPEVPPVYPQYELPEYGTTELARCDIADVGALDSALHNISAGTADFTVEQYRAYQCLISEGSLAGDSIWLVVIKAVVVLAFLLISVLFALWFERRLIARFQERPGPNVHGPFGLMQSVMDAMKLLFKEDITVRAADKLMYLVAPVISVLCAFLVFAVIPFGPPTRIIGTGEVTPLQLTDFPVAVLYILACAALGVYGIVLGGWSSGSTYPLMGSIRSTAQVISYELAMGLSLVTVFMVAGSMSTSQIVDSQRDALWWAVPLAPAFILYVISMIGETNRLPFDLPEAEGELVAGFMTEYSSMKFAWFFLAEYVNMINVSAVASVLFLGGWSPLWHEGWAGYEMMSTGIFPPIWLILKIWIVMGFFVWVRGSVLRFRYDQFMKLGWKVLIPAGLVWLTFFAVGRQIMESKGWNIERFTYFSGAVAILFTIAIVLFVKGDSDEDEKPRRRRSATVIDPFAGGYPVPPRPGEALPPSPRSPDSVEGRARKKGGNRG